MSTPSVTPRTDELLALIPTGTIAALWHFDKAIALSGALETDLTTATRRIAELEAALDRCKWAAQVADNEKKARIAAEAELAEARKEIESLRNYLPGD